MFDTKGYSNVCCVDIFLQKIYWMKLNLSTSGTKGFHKDFWNLKLLQKILFERNWKNEFFHSKIHNFLNFWYFYLNVYLNTLKIWH